MNGRQCPIKKWFVAAMLLLPLDAFAQWQYDPKQLSLLPAYCKHTQLYRAVAPGGNNPAQIEYWRARMGGDENFAHMHHYCWALENTNRALYERTKVERDRRLGESLGDLGYVIARVRPDFVLLPEILTKRAENLISLGRATQALPDLLRAIELRPDYWPPYATLSDHYKQLGDVASARSWLEKGLAASPQAKPLETRLRNLNAARTAK